MRDSLDILEVGRVLLKFLTKMQEERKFKLYFLRYSDRKKEKLFDSCLILQKRRIMQQKTHKDHDFTFYLRYVLNNQQKKNIIFFCFREKWNNKTKKTQRARLFSD